MREIADFFLEGELTELLAPIEMKILFRGAFVAAKKIVMESGTGFEDRNSLNASY
ncbi:hypothetical protein [Kaistella sp.]|uniref:hypothetical protein n=1 Tax=Kaistella sp. TaxID=2782235 RepID=UPI0035A0D28E